MTLADIEHHIGTLPYLVLDNSVLLAGAALLAWLVTSIGLIFVKHRDPRADFLADFLGINPEEVIPLPPSTALWNDYYRLNSEASADSHFPHGAPSLQGTYLVHAKGGMTLVAIHNFDDVKLYHDPEEAGLLDYIEPSIGTHGRMDLHRIPVDIYEDAARRSRIVEFLLKAKFGYPGKVRAITLLRDKASNAPEADTIFTPSGESLSCLSFDDQDAARKTLKFEENPVRSRKLPEISKWFQSYPARQASKWRLIVCSSLLIICALLIFFGHRGVDADAVKEVIGPILS